MGEPWSAPGLQDTAMAETPQGAARTPVGASGGAATVTVTVPTTAREALPVASRAS